MAVLSYEFESRKAQRIVLFAWLAVPAAVLGFILTRYLSDGRVALVASQLLFVGVAAASFACLAWAASRAPRGSRGRAVWMLLSVAIGLMALSEALYSWALLTDGVGSMTDFWIPDVLNAAAALVFIAMLAASASVERIGRLAAARVIVDLSAIAVLSFATLYRLAIAGMVASGSSSEALDGVRYAIYATIGLLILAGDGLLIASVPARRLRPWDKLLGIGIAIFGAGVLFWPVWSLAAEGASIPEPVSAVVNTFYLLGYLLMGIAGLQRSLATEVPWRDWSTSGGSPVWVGVAISSIVFASLIILGMWAITAPADSVAGAVYLTALSVAAVCAVARTMLVSVESRRLRVKAWTDPVTGTGNLYALKRRIGELIAAGQRSDVAFALAVVDLDEFSALNAEHGTDHGDSILRAVSSALTDRFGRSTVFRMQGDEFGIVLEPSTPQDAEEVGRSILEALRTGADVQGVTASVGVAVWPSAVTTLDDVVMGATEACLWVKRHGGSHYAVYDERLDAALSVDRRMRPTAAGRGVDMARALSAAADVRDPANYHHSRNVAALSVLLAGELGFDPEHTERLQIAAMLHDVGKIALPDAMLGGRLVAVKQRHIEREHSAMGQRLLEALRIEGVPLWVRSHHERWDGQGFPDGLSELEIPIEARMIALADAYDGMTAGKRYGAPMSKAAALQEIDLGIGVRFDPILAEKFIAVIGSTKALGWVDGWPAA